jgi:hypothetical protein
VPTDVQAGPAQTTVRCAGAGAATHALLIVGRLIEPKITVTKQGFTTRANPGAGTRLSYGLILHNDAPDRDAMNVSVQTNFVMGDNNLLGTDTQRITGIPAGSDYALGRMINFPGIAPITRLEVVIQVEKYQPRSLHNPTLANIHLVPGLYDPSWLGTIEGELQNTDLSLSLQSADLSAVIFDTAGNVIGGGSGFAGNVLFHQSSAVVVGSGVQAELRKLPVQLDPGNLEVVDRSCKHQPRQRMNFQVLRKRRAWPRKPLVK